MRKNFWLLILTAALVACSGNGVSSSAINSSSSESPNASSNEESISSEPSSSSASSSSSDPGPQLTDEEKAVKEITDYLGSNPLAFEGTYTAVDSYIPDLNKPDDKVVQRSETYGSYVTVITDDYLFNVRDLVEGRKMVNRYDRDENGYMVYKTINPLTNQREDVIVEELGQKLIFDQRVGNPFKNDNVYKSFELKDNRLVTKSTEDSDIEFFQYKKLVSASTGGMYGDFNRLVITLDENKKPDRLSIYYWNPGKFTIQEYTFEGKFITVEEANVPAIPTVHEHKPEHDALQSKFDALFSGMDYQVDYAITQGSRVSELSMYVNSDIYYIDYTYDRSVNVGGYYVRSQGLTDLVYTDEGVKAKCLPKKVHSVKEIFEPYWRFKAEDFYLDNEGNYVLHDTLLFYDSIRSYLVPDFVAFNFSYVNSLSFKFTIDGDDLLYTYETFDTIVQARVSNIGSTSMPFTRESIIPYQRRMTMSDLIASLKHPSQRASYEERIGLLTCYNPDILPYVDTAYEHSSKMECIGNVEVGLMYTIDIIFNFRFDSSGELWEAMNAYTDLLEANPDYVYDYEKERYLYEHDDLYFQITFEIHENYNGYPFALVYSIINLHEAPPLDF